MPLWVLGGSERAREACKCSRGECLLASSVTALTEEKNSIDVAFALFFLLARFAPSSFASAPSSCLPLTPTRQRFWSRRGRLHRFFYRRAGRGAAAAAGFSFAFKDSRRRLSLVVD